MMVGKTAPAAAKPDRFLGKDGKPLQFYDAVVGGKSVGVPGTVRMLELAHQKYGKLPWSQLFQPLSDSLNKAFPSRHACTPAEQRTISTPLRASESYFYQPNGKPKPVGTQLINKPYAEVLRQIAQTGADAFYKGEIAGDIVATVTKATVPGRLNNR
jgi:gamma-glutamyltranspeptidase/glutathione hydrolase